jgi:hypothetical protein
MGSLGWPRVLRVLWVLWRLCRARTAGCSEPCQLARVLALRELSGARPRVSQVSVCVCARAGAWGRPASGQRLNVRRYRGAGGLGAPSPAECPVLHVHLRAIPSHRPSRRGNALCGSLTKASPRRVIPCMPHVACRTLHAACCMCCALVITRETNFLSARPFGTGAPALSMSCPSTTLECVRPPRRRRPAAITGRNHAHVCQVHAIATVACVACTSICGRGNVRRRTDARGGRPAL